MCLALALGWVLACSDPGAPQLLLDLDGRYVGSWQVIARDTAEVCSISGVCGHPTLATVNCEVTLDVYRTGESSFTGNFSIPNAGTECHRTGFEPAVLDSVRVPNQFLAEVDDEVLPYEAVPDSWRLRMEVSSSRRVDLERLVGCTLLGAWSDWLMFGVLVRYTDGEGLLTTISGEVIYREQFERGDRGGPHQAALCGDRRVDLGIGFHVERIS